MYNSVVWRNLLSWFQEFLFLVERHKNKLLQHIAPAHNYHPRYSEGYTDWRAAATGVRSSGIPSGKQLGDVLLNDITKNDIC